MNFFMIREHPTEDKLMVQVGNMRVELNTEHQKELYKVLKERLLEE